MVNWINVTDMTTTSTTAKSSSSDSLDSQATIDDATSSGIAEIIFRPNTGAINQHWLGGLNSGTVSSGHDCDYQFRGSGSSGTNLYDVYVPTNSRVLANQSYTFGDWFKITYDFSTGTVTWYKSADVSPKVWTTIYTLTGQTKTSISGFASGYALNAGIQDVGGSSPSTATVLLPPPYSEVVF